jgi:hypothetical protein
MGDESVKVVGLAALIRSLKRAEIDIGDLKDANVAAGQIVLNQARALVPRRTGRLAATGRTNRAAKKASVMFGNARVPYAGVIEYGWPGHNIKPEPYLIPAVEETKSEWLGAYEKDLQALLDSVKGA